MTDYILGIDAGGTKTLGRLLHPATGRSWQLKMGSASLTNDYNNAAATLYQLISNLFELAQCRGEQVTVVAGVPGAGNVQLRTSLELHLAELCPQLWVTTDAKTSVWGANAGQPVAVVALGTGSVGMRLEANGEERQFGGWGFNIGDEGSGAILGKMAVRQVLDEFDRRRSFDSQLAKAVTAVIGTDPANILGWLKHAVVNDFSRLAPLVLPLAEQCPQAAKVFERYVADVVALIDLTCLDVTLPVVILGGLAEGTLPHLPERIRRQVIPAAGTSVDGALLLAERWRQGELEKTEPRV
ncbi:MAG: ATPase [Alkalimonas sp.]|nr:ATPase [Alkalimonas sp.]